MSDKKRVMLLMSGGVDSSYCATKLVEQGHEVSGLYLILHDNEAMHKENIAKGQQVCEAMGIRHSVLDGRELFQKKVYKYFVDSYAEGITPNPCAMCNPSLKFGLAYEHAMSLGYHYMATGHYVKTDGEHLIQADDKSKDQSYFLFAVPKDTLQNLLFPMGDKIKAEIKQEALDYDHLSAISLGGESQEICFVDADYLDILKKHIDVDRPGDVIDKSGNVVGEHKGYMHYTIGKRKGFTVKGAHDPHYVLEIDSECNRITVGAKEDLAISRVIAEELNLYESFGERACLVKLRYRMEKIPCTVRIRDHQAEIVLDNPAFGVARGQAAVFYDDEKVIGGGWITQTAYA